MRNTAERRQNILKLLCERRFEKIENLVAEFNVSRRTICYDIQILSCSYPIYSETGIYGGIYIAEGFSLGMKYLSDKQLDLLIKVSLLLTEEDDVYTLQTIINTYKNPIGSKDDNKSESIKIIRKIKSNSFNVKEK